VEPFLKLSWRCGGDCKDVELVLEGSCYLELVWVDEREWFLVKGHLEEEGVT
jgi:hypothetical protein